MRWRAISFLFCAVAWAQKPSADEQRRTWEAARAIALHYSATLPNFLCTETVQRVDNLARTTTTDKLTVQVSYFGQKESYKLTAINGNRTSETLESLGGLLSGGEFGTLLMRVFDPSSQAEFEWKSWSSVRKRRVAIYTYHVPRGRSHYMLGYRAGTGEMVSAAAGYRGEVTIDAGTSQVLRLTSKADDIPKESGILQSSMEVDYDFADVAGHSYLLPVHAEARMTRPHREISNVVTFGAYRKFAAESTIDFGKPGR